MLTSSRYLMNGSPRCCMFCGEPFRPRDGYVEVWRTSAGQHFCSEFCAAPDTLSDTDDLFADLIAKR